MIVVDTNVLVYLLIDSDLTTHAAKVRQKDRHWVAPMLWRSEFRNVSLGYFRRNAISMANLISLFELAESKVESRQVDATRVIELAVDSGCTAYDCEYVYLAEILAVPLVTSDKEVLAAFPNLAVSMNEFLA
ncbi:MAG: type II toxin-antitoxin system VapC family toxin [Pyrinomonadaceae bacterium]